MRRQGGGEWRHSGFGLTFTCDFALPGLPALDAAERAELDVRIASAEEVAAAWGQPARGGSAVESVLDGLTYKAERGAAGDHRFLYGDRASFHLSDDGRTLLCAPSDPYDPAWRRVLLDSVLATVSLLHGFEALHAAAVAGAGGVVTFMGRTGGGKTTLAAELVRRGLPLVCDDLLVLSRDVHGAVLAHPGPAVMNLPHTAPPISAERLAEFAEEDWVAVEQAATEPAPLAAFCLLDRRPGLDAAIHPAQASAVQLLAHGLRSGRHPERMRARFELFADVAEQVPSFVIEAAPSIDPGRLADLAQSAIPALRAAPAAGAAR